MSRAEQTHVDSNVSRGDATIVLRIHCFATFAVEFPNDMHCESASASKLVASAIVTSVKKDAFMEKVKELLEMYGGLPTGEKPQLLFPTFGRDVDFRALPRT